MCNHIFISTDVSAVAFVSPLLDSFINSNVLCARQLLLHA